MLLSFIQSFASKQVAKVLEGKWEEAVKICGQAEKEGFNKALEQIEKSLFTNAEIKNICTDRNGNLTRNMVYGFLEQRNKTQEAINELKK